MNADVCTVLQFLHAAQTLVALYSSPNGPTDCDECYRHLVDLLESPKLLAAQLALTPPNKIVMMEPNGPPLVL